MMSSNSIASASKRLAALLALVIGATLFLVPTEASAQEKQIVVLKFTGPRSAGIRGGVIKVVKRAADLVGQAKFARQQRKLRARSLSDENIAKVARNMGLDGVLVGKVQRRGGKYRLRLELHAGADGAVVETVTVTLGRRPRLTKRAERLVRNKINRAIADLPPLEEEEAADEGEWEDESEDLGGDSVAKDEPISDDDDGEADAKVETKAKSKPLSDKEMHAALARDRAIDVSAGLSVVGRSFDFTVAAGIMDTPNGYNGAPVPGATIAAEIYPMAFDKKAIKKKGAIANIGVAVTFEKILQISSKLENSDVDIPTTQQRWGVGVRYRLNLGDSPTSPSVKVGVGYNKLEFQLDKEFAAGEGLMIDLPNVAYTFFDPGVSGRYPLNLDVALYADAKFLVITDTGEIQTTDSFGSASVSGLEADAGFEYRLDARLLFRAGIHLTRIAFDFDGNGAESDRDGDGNSDVGGALDQYLGGYATAGYLF